MGTIKVDTIEPRATSSDITLLTSKFTGNTAGNLSVTGEGGVTQTNLQQGLSKTWVMIADNASINDSLKVASHTDVTDGRQSMTLTNAFRATTTMAGAACAAETGVSNGSGNSNRYAFFIRGDNTSQCFMNTGSCNDGALEDCNVSSGIMCGDLA